MNSINYIMIERSDSILRYSAVLRFAFPGPHPGGKAEIYGIGQRELKSEFGMRNGEI